MDTLNATDPFLLALQHYDSPDILELCHLFTLNLFMHHYGRTRTFVYLQREHESRNLNIKRSIQALWLLFGLTWLLSSPCARQLARLLHWRRRR